MKKLTELMAVRVCDLNLNLQKSHLYARILQLYDELRSQNLKFRPPCYFADEWFVPEGDPVIGVPFYLANRDLIRLERKMMGEVEGDNPKYFMKLLRHEAGHAISYAFKLYRKRSYRKIFGPSNLLFSDFYRFNKRSKQYVIHLQDYYAQSHPDEDFAETFAVWLVHPEKVWRRRYKGWKALKKIEFVHELMRGIKGKSPLVKTGEKMCQVSSLKYTLWTYYMRRRAILGHHR